MEQNSEFTTEKKEETRKVEISYDLDNMGRPNIFPMHFLCEHKNAYDAKINFAVKTGDPVSVGMNICCQRTSWEIIEILEKRKTAGEWPEDIRPDFYSVHAKRLSLTSK